MAFLDAKKTYLRGRFDAVDTDGKPLTKLNGSAAHWTLNGVKIPSYSDLLHHAVEYGHGVVQVEDAGETLTEDEIVCTTMVLVEAGHEATVNTLGNGFRALMYHPNEWKRLTTGSVAPNEAVEELLRWDSPLQMFERWVLDEGVEIAGQPIGAGEEIAMLFGSAQRDPRRFDEPDRFDIGRNDAAHIGFGGGIHFCIGAPLARMELATSIAGLVERFPSLELAAEPEYHSTFVIRGLQELRLAPSRSNRA
jgi:cytochrome P450